MPTAIERLARLQQEMTQTSFYDGSLERYLSFFEVGGLLCVHYYGPTHRPCRWPDEEEDEIPANQLPIFEVLSQPEVASRIASLTFDGPDEGSHGTREWNFDWLLAQDATFPELRTLVIQPSPLEAYNTTIVDSAFAGWLSRAPKLVQLTTPSAPEPAFFKVEHEPLHSMHVEVGYDAQDFILNLSRCSSRFILKLDWSEASDFNIDEGEVEATSFEHFEALFSSEACPDGIILRNPRLSDDQLRKLAALQQEACRGRYPWMHVYSTSFRAFS